MTSSNRFRGTTGMRACYPARASLAMSLPCSKNLNIT
jgi:hypothetical protein